MQVLEGEQHQSRDGFDAYQGSTGRRFYRLQLEAGETEDDLRTYCKANLPKRVTGADEEYYYRTGIKTTEGENNIWDVEANYTQLKPAQISVSTTGGTEKIEFSRETIAAFDSQGKIDVANGGFQRVPNFHRGINVGKNGVEGTQVPVRQSTFKVTKSFAIEDLDEDFFDALENLPTTVNDSDLTLEVGTIRRRYRAGELRLDGTEGVTTDDARFELTCSFAVSRGIYPDDPETYESIGEIQVTDKAGWDLLWSYAVEASDPDTGTMLRRVSAVYVERIFRGGDFTLLRLAPDE